MIYSVDDTSLIAVAEAIRAKTGKSDPLTLAQMPSEIESIEGGGEDVFKFPTGEAGFYRHGTNFTELLCTWDEYIANGVTIDGQFYEGGIYNSNGSSADSGYLMFSVPADVIIPQGYKYDLMSIECGNIVIPADAKSVSVMSYNYMHPDSNVGLTTLYIKDTTPDYFSFYESEVSPITKIVVPTGCANAYKSATGWCDYAEIMVEEGTVIGGGGTYIPSVAAGIYRHGSNFTEMLYPWDEIWGDGVGSLVGDIINTNAGDHNVSAGEYPIFEAAGDLVIPSKVWVTGIVTDIGIMQLVCGNVVFGDNPELTIYGLSDLSYYYPSSLAGCHMEAIYCKSEIPPTLDACLTGYGEGTDLPYLTKVVVPKGCADAYKSATNWSIFADIIVEADV